MRYYHVIYTSSQKGLNGSNGFGIRTATKGTPREYLDAVIKGVADNKFANIVTNCNVPTPQELIDSNGQAIRRVPPRYFFMPLDISEGRRIYTIGRNIYVGFTETFYYKDKDGNILGKSGRMGTYLIDMYLFEECPTQDVFEILYEQPKEETKDAYNRFVPLDPSPHKENFEMAELTTGDPVMLEEKEKAFLSKVEQVSPKVVDLLLAILDAKLSGKQLFVKYPWQQTHQLIADVFRFLPQGKFPQLTFSTNYTGNGYNAPSEILFVNEYYMLQFSGKGLFVDLEIGTYQSQEANAFRKLIENALKQNNLDKIRRIVEWVLSPEYEAMGNVSGDTKAIMFLYSQMPNDFDISMIDNAQNRDELVDTMANYFKMHSSNAVRFLQLLTDKVDICYNFDQILPAVKELEYYSSKGINVSSVIVNQKIHINDVLMNPSEPRNVTQAISTLGLNVVRKYTDDLNDGKERTDLADALFTIWKENIPYRLEDIRKNLTMVKIQNDVLYKLILENFSTLFGNTYEKLVSSVNGTNIERTKVELEDNIIKPLKSEPVLKNDSIFQGFEMLYHLFDDDETSINDGNLYKIADLIRKTGLAKSKVGQKAKGMFLENASNVSKSFEYLHNIWGMTTSDIIRECQKSPFKKDLIKGCLEGGSYRIEEVIHILKSSRFSDDDIKSFLSKSEKYKRAYSSYRKKKILSNLFSMITSIFKRKPKGMTTHQEAFDVETAKKDIIDLLQDPKTVEKINSYLKGNDAKPIIKKKGDLVKRLYKEEKNTGKTIPELKAFRDVLKGMAFLLLFVLFPLNLSAVSQNDAHDAYGDIKDALKCYIVTPQTLNVRTSPSLYKGKNKKTKRKDNVGFKLNQGDTVFLTFPLLPITADGVKWINFTHNGSDYYTDFTRLNEVDNPRYLQQQNTTEEKSGGFWDWVKGLFCSNDKSKTIVFGDGFLGWLQRSAPTILLILTIIWFIIYFFVDFLDFGENMNVKRFFLAEVRHDTGMRPMFMYSLRPYLSIFTLSLAILGCFIASIILMLVLGGTVWGLLWLVKLLLWALIVIGWILVVVGVICIFINWAIAIPALIIGGLISYYQETLEAWGNNCVATGMAFFDAINVWQFSLDLVKDYWVQALTISLTPIALFLVAAALVFLVALCMRGYEAWTTHRYNVKHPCPWCHEPSEPAEYYDDDPNEGQVKLPTQLRPGIYGLLHITHPVTNNHLPTLIANGRDALIRKCPHCGNFINFEAGTEKHIGFIGMPDSGKTSLLCNTIGMLMKTKPDMHFTNTLDENIKEILEDVDFAKANGHLDANHLPPKTDRNWRPSIQCIMPRSNGGLPYHLYFNDVSGELFTAGGNDKNLLRFSQDIESIIFIIDPWTMKINEEMVSEGVRKWLEKEEVKQMRVVANEEALNAFDSMVNALDFSKRDFAQIDLTFALVKSDTGYLEGVITSDKNALRDFMRSDLRLGNLVHAAETRFKSVSYVAVSVFHDNDKGVKTLCDNLLQQLEIES